MIIKAVIFDIDGTLVESNDMHVLAWQEAFASVGAKFDKAAIHEQIGKGTDMLVPTLLPEADEKMLKKLGEVHGEIFKRKFLQAVKAFPGAHDLLARVRAAGKLAVLASSASAGDLDHYLDLLKARDLVAATTSADDVEHTKPAPDIFASALAKVAPLTSDQVLVVGDTPYDVQAATRCGIAAVAVRSGNFSDEVLRHAGPLALYDDVAALLAGFDNSPLAQ
ncbi:HAD family hydrolase [Tianweitania sediminis]|uniref:HAD family hydrolase n=1 Tax=Tianweitania sediminis TaxID=1502156 RepID=A0A8J7QYM4_9HYPH|nr:HAD family hydrolase [Tianweitania sediminis]MBP0437188.1 HAD family hydrolase [Tianweitania sediminis]